ncbi:hypothetical protein [Lichenifustis flavocetrariae]|uniref:Uncharacterized protein n=1 Tax=Lichenifustis flavocetrariae TaxID=2949735 RepID=A0AA42CIB3_9HYPH|nr:hypothetical protein [Lichenifustis flavocetrariae]MCW6508179.1 hypothetical protein [Lichenifustis flavocetrariae]
MSRDHPDLEYVAFERDDPAPAKGPAAPAKGGALLRRLPTPVWQTRQKDLPLLSSPPELSKTWSMRFTGRASREMESFAFATTGHATLKYVAVVVPKGVRPSAWLIYFRHTAQAKDFSGNLLELGAGDYIEGRMQVAKQIAISEKNVGAILPIAMGSCGEFAGNQAFVTKCLEEIELSLYGTHFKPMLLAASNSDGLFQLDKFLQNCPTLRTRLKGIYDFDGTHHVKSGGISLVVPGARTFRYEGRLSPTPETVPGRDWPSDEIFLTRRMSANPAMVPLALSRWRQHSAFGSIRPGENPLSTHKKGDPLNEAHTMVDFNWLHHHIPTCMLHHGLVSTPGL